MTAPRLLSNHSRMATAAYLAAFLIAATRTSAAHGQLKRPLEAIAAKLKPTRTVVYKQVGVRSLHLHLFEPDGHKPSDRRPAFLAIHGGGWTGGDARRFYPVADWFRQQGFLGVSLEYRLLNSKTEITAKTKTTVFDCVKDGRSAVRYLRSHAAELGIDPHRIVVAGGSAGGHVAAGTALFDDVNEDSDDLSVSPHPNVLVLFYPVIDTSAAGYGQKKIGDRWQELSPVHHVRKDLPPTLILHGTGDTVTPYAGARSFFDQTQAAGNYCELISHPDGRHGYFIFDLQLYEQAMQQTLKFLRARQIARQRMDQAFCSPPTAFATDSQRYASSRSGKQFLHRAAGAVFGGVEGTAFDLESRLRTDAHCREDRCVQVGDADGVFDRHQRAFRGGGSVEEALLHAAAEHNDGRPAGEVAMLTVVFAFLDRVDLERRLIRRV